LRHVGANFCHFPLDSVQTRHLRPEKRFKYASATRSGPTFSGFATGSSYGAVDSHVPDQNVPDRIAQHAAMVRKMWVRKIQLYRRLNSVERIIGMKDENLVFYA
jgi:hypothetical protein